MVGTLLSTSHNVASSFDPLDNVVQLDTGHAYRKLQTKHNNIPNGFTICKKYSSKWTNFSKVKQQQMQANMKPEQNKNEKYDEEYKRGTDMRQA